MVKYYGSPSSKFTLDPKRIPKEVYRVETESDKIQKEKARYYRERNDHITKELIKHFDFGTESRKNYDLLKSQAHEFLRTVGIKNHVFNRISIATHEQLEKLQIDYILKRSEHSRTNFLQKLNDELDAVEEQHLRSFYDKKSLVQREIIAMLQKKKHKDLFMDDFLEDEEQHLEKLKPADFIGKT